ncbi:MAG: sensor domain-containing diguanylate cyclase [Actinobacteria bacterium]|nr:MAG: sensor domain-containing diguanylate cyclase [Actinomycetota bacterium]
MVEAVAALQIQQLVELLAVVSSLPDEAAAVVGAAERAAQALEAEVAVVIIDRHIAAAVGFPAEEVPEEELFAIADRQLDKLSVPDVGDCYAIAAGWAGAHPGHLVLARYDEGFSVEETNLIRGMARLLELTLTMHRTLAAEHEMRQRSERQAAENAELLASLQQRQRLLEHLSGIQRAISLRQSLPEILESVTDATQDLLGDEIVALWLREPGDPDRVRLAAWRGMREEVARRLAPVPLTEAGVAGEAILADGLVTNQGQPSTLTVDLVPGRQTIAMAAPVRESGVVTGALLVASCEPQRQFGDADTQTLRAFAEHVSLALTDAKTVDQMRQAYHDSLTGLATRGLFLERLTQQLSLAAREGVGLALLFFDLDHFKEVNDTLGHAAGDQLLMTIAHRVKEQLRGSDVAARFGGDEFAAMLWDVGAPGDGFAAAVADRLLAAIEAPVPLGERAVRVTASIGIAYANVGETEPGPLMRRADLAMYRAKHGGRGRAEVSAED